MKKEALEVLKNRRAIRKFKAEQISEEELKTVLEAGTFAPTGAGTQGVKIVASIALGYADCDQPVPKPRKDDYFVIV